MNPRHVAVQNAVIVARRVYDSMVAEVVVAELAWMGSYDWIGDDRRLQALIDGVLRDQRRLERATVGVPRSR